MMYSIKMRCSKGGPHEEGGKHISGAERILREDEIEEELINVYRRAITHERGKPDFINLKIEKIDEDEHITFSRDITDAIMTYVSDVNSVIALQIDTEYLKRSFSFGFEDTSTQTLGTLDNVYYLCDEGIRKGKRFTGAMIGVYAYAGETSGTVKFKDFEYNGC